MMVRRIILFIYLSVTASMIFSQGDKKKPNFSSNLDIGADVLTFFQTPSYEGQKQVYPSFFIKPKFSLDWDEGNSNINFEGFARWDINGESRTHWDVRELYYQYFQGDFEFNAGVKKIFWGKTEGVHLVDVINQVDFLEGIDGEEKLGQPMLQLSYTTNIGTFSGFFLPYTRTLQFGNQAGRPRIPDTDLSENISFASDKDAWNPTFAIRWEHFIGNSDLGAHYFIGNAREPLLVLEDNKGFALNYPTVNQIGLDYQIIVNSVIFKFESIFRSGDFDNIFAITSGAEYTFGNVNGKGLDIGVLAEYVFDNRRELTFSSLDNDVFFATRLAFNNVVGTEVLFGVFQDLSKSTTLVRLEHSQRVGSNFKLTLTGQGFFNVDERELSYLFRRDSFLEIELVRYF